MLDIIRLVHLTASLRYRRMISAPTEQAGERPETHRFARSKRACERFVIACGGVPARWATWNLSLCKK